MSTEEEKRIRRMIRGGSVFYLVMETDANPEFHYFVVLNYFPKSDKAIILVRAATHSESFHDRRDHLSDAEKIATMIDVSPKEFSKFDRPTCFDCNEAEVVSISKLFDKLKSKKLSHVGYLNDGTLDRLRVGFMNSAVVERKHKYMLIKKKKRQSSKR